METDLANRTGHHNYSVDMNNDTMTRPMTPATELNSLANNPLYVVNYNNTRPDKTVNITRERLSRGNVHNCGDSVYQEPRDILFSESPYDPCPPPKPVLK